MSRRKHHIFLALVCAFSCLLAFAATPDTGQKAPDFSLPTPDGHLLSLASFTQQGPVVLIVLRGYPGYQCPFCTRQVHDFIEHADKFAAIGAQVLLVYPGPGAHLDQHAREALSQQNPLPGNVHLVTDADYQFTNQYGLRWDAPEETAYPATFLIDRRGFIFYRNISRSHGDRTAATDILAKLQAAVAGH
jgi:peroxiredoxin